MRGNIAFAIIVAIVAAVITGIVGFVFATHERGYFAVGGEMFLPVLAFALTYHVVMRKEEKR